MSQDFDYISAQVPLRDLRIFGRAAVRFSRLILIMPPPSRSLKKSVGGVPLQEIPEGKGGERMRFYTRQHKYYCGISTRDRSMCASSTRRARSSSTKIFAPSRTPFSP